MITGQKKNAKIDLLILLAVTLAMLVIYIILGERISAVLAAPGIAVLAKVGLVAFFQFGVTGLGIVILSLWRRETLGQYGLRRKGLRKALLLSALCCLPEFLCHLVQQGWQGYFPFSGVMTTQMVLESALPTQIAGMAITVICWGFWEGFFYPVLRNKIDALLPTKHRFWSFGSLVGALWCIFSHGMVGTSPAILPQMLCTMILIYGMLLVQKETGNAWGCVAIFCFYWNAIR